MLLTNSCFLQPPKGHQLRCENGWFDDAAEVAEFLVNATKEANWEDIAPDSDDE